MNISPVKFKVLERCTGHKKVEEWTFLPKDWNHDLKIWSDRPVIFEKNFALLKFETWNKVRRRHIYDFDDILILNLVTRKSFSMRSTTVITQFKEKAAGRIDWRNLRIHQFPYLKWNGIIVKNDRLECIECKIRIKNEENDHFLG